MNKLFSIRFFVTAIAVLFSLLSQAQVPAGDYPNTTDAQGRKQGAWKKLDEKGHAIYVGQFKDDKPFGKFTYFDVEERIMVVSEFSQNGTVCRSKMYSVAGKLQAEGKYINQQKDSVWLFYDASGFLISQEQFKLGKKEGVSVTYYPGTKQAAETKTFKNGIEEGAWLQYYDSGKKKCEANYVAGNIEGKYIYYYESGNINILGAYQHAVKNGVWTYFNPDGTVKMKETYVYGKLQGKEQVIKPEDMQKEQLKYNQNEDQGGQPGGQ